MPAARMAGQDGRLGGAGQRHGEDRPGFQTTSGSDRVLRQAKCSLAVTGQGDEWAESRQRVRLDPFAEGIAAGDFYGAFEMVPGPVVLPINDRGPA
jgi:hypothetical protein